MKLSPYRHLNVNLKTAKTLSSELLGYHSYFWQLLWLLGTSVTD